LRDFHRSEVFSVLVSHGEVSYVDEAVVHLYPEFRGVLFAGCEGFDDFVDHVNAFLWVTELHASADY